MGLRNYVTGAVLALVLATPAAKAENVALIVGNSHYLSFNAVPNAAEVLDAAPAFEQAGYEVIQIGNATEAQTKSALERFETLHDSAERVVVVLSGQFMQAGMATYFAPVDLASPSLANVAYDTLPLSALLAFLAEKPGKAALFLGEYPPEAAVGVQIDKGVGAFDVPQGVIVVRGTPKSVTEALRSQFLQAGVSTAKGAALAQGLTVSGFVSDLASLNGSSDPQEDDSQAAETIDPEAAYWGVAEDLGSKASYQAYLRRYPNGEFAVQAVERLQVIADAVPQFSPEEQAERDLALSRNDRRRVQEQLSLLGFDPNGIDGVFGAGSRAAIARWQTQNEQDGEGFLNAPSLKRLRLQSERRAADLAQEARRAKQAQDAADAKLWAQTGARGTEADYLAYLSKFPDGLYAEPARKALDQIEADNREKALAAERLAWDQARQANTLENYRGFLRAYPNGTFAANAQRRIGELTAQDQEEADQQKAELEEESLQMSTAMKILVERKLKALDLKPGKQDGEFTKATRGAVREYQSARGLPVSGFVTRQTIVRLMSE